jgi:hypothetical protein
VMQAEFARTYMYSHAVQILALQRACGHTTHSLSLSISLFLSFSRARSLSLSPPPPPPLSCSAAGAHPESILSVISYGPGER